MPKLRQLKLFLFSFLISLLSPPSVYAQTESWENSPCISKSSGVSFATLQCFEYIFANILRIIIPLAGLASFVILIVGGFQYLTSAGDLKQTQKASSVIIGAIIGLAVTVAVYLVFSLLEKITGLDLLQFAIPGSQSSSGGGSRPGGRIHPF